MAHGHGVKAITAPTDIKGHYLAASPDKPEILIETDAGKRAARKPGVQTRE